MSRRNKSSPLYHRMKYEIRHSPKTTLDPAEMIGFWLSDTTQDGVLKSVEWLRKLVIYRRIDTLKCEYRCQLNDAEFHILKAEEYLRKIKEMEKEL